MLKRVRKDSIEKKDASQASEFIDLCLNILSEIAPSRVSKFRIGSDEVRHTVYGRALSEFMLPAIAHLTSDAGREADFQIYSVDGSACGIQLPRPFWSWDDLDTQGYIQGINSSEVTAQYDAYTGTFRILHRARRQAIHWVLDMSRVPYWERSFPLRALINWWHRDTALQPLHAAAVGIDNKAVLLTAKGGSGKSTTALKCLLGGMQYLGDDFVLVDTQQQIVHSLYNVVKLTEEDFKHFPEFKSESMTGTKEDQDKVQVFLNEKFNDQIIASASLTYILVPRIVKSEKTYLSEISFEEVMEALTTSTLYLLRGASSDALKKITHLVKSLPAHYLNLGADFNASPLVIRKLLASI
ncbi:MAG: hypothetical protein DRI69_03505 [Bacteroidetes bacterium]|nr:MAG: hypothetical protein DRI69_03505 [Bacteroidota bacterium]